MIGAAGNRSGAILLSARSGTLNACRRRPCASRRTATCGSPSAPSGGRLWPPERGRSLFASLHALCTQPTSQQPPGRRRRGSAPHNHADTCATTERAWGLPQTHVDPCQGLEDNITNACRCWATNERISLGLRSFVRHPPRNGSGRPVGWCSFLVRERWMKLVPHPYPPTCLYRSGTVSGVAIHLSRSL
jgi:hypothetical protein